MTANAQMIDDQHNRNDLFEARRVLSLEAYALEALHATLDDNFVQAIDTIANSKGHVIVSGMGKSGHVARKIAATLASTGTPSFFIHPAEASHGDLGMISPDDVILLLSCSGETSELSDILTYSRRYRLPLIAMTQRAQSTLAQTADVALILPDIEEACPLQLAPTTSTTMMIALGDALATTLLKHRGFSPSDFGSLHPGGKLGQRLLHVEQIMHKGDKIPLMKPDTLMQDVVIFMSAKGFGTVGFIDDENKLLGIITDGDLRRHMSAELLQQQAYEIMSFNPSVIAASALVEEALSFMNSRGRTGLFVINSNDTDHHPIGFIHIHDCLRAGLR